MENSPSLGPLIIRVLCKTCTTVLTDMIKIFGLGFGQKESDLKYIFLFKLFMPKNHLM